MNVEAQERVKQQHNACCMYMHHLWLLYLQTSTAEFLRLNRNYLHVVLISLMCGEMVAMVLHGWALQCISVTLAYW